MIISTMYEQLQKYIKEQIILYLQIFVLKIRLNIRKIYNTNLFENLKCDFF